MEILIFFALTIVFALSLYYVQFMRFLFGRLGNSTRALLLFVPIFVIWFCISIVYVDFVFAVVTSWFRGYESGTIFRAIWESLR